MPTEHECKCTECYVSKKEPKKCPGYSINKDYFGEIKRKYIEDEFVARIAIGHSKLLGRGSSRWPRIEHIREFCVQAGINKVGLACCSGFLKEANFVKSYFEQKKIESFIVCCKIGALKLEDIDVYRNIGYDYYLCNSVAQAQILNDHNVEMNVLLGLCAPHDMLFSWCANAPSTTLFTKEHISDHAPSHTLQKLIQGKKL
jgi:uncharacterized metal-binding protein